MTSIFISYAHADEPFRVELGKHLKMLERQGAAITWHDRKIPPGALFAQEIDRALADASIIVFLISADFLNSDYCMDVEVPAALARMQAGNAKVVPVILRDCIWKRSSIAHLNALPKDGQPIATHPDQDRAYREVVEGLAGLIAAPSQAIIAARAESAMPPLAAAMMLATNVRKSFSQLEQDDFRDMVYLRIASLFEASLLTLQNQHPELSARFNTLDARRFVASIYRDGAKITACTLYCGGSMGDIALSLKDDGDTSSANEILTVDTADGRLGLRPMMSQRSSQASLSADDAATHLWRMFTRQLGD